MGLGLPAAAARAAEPRELREAALLVVTGRWGRGRHPVTPGDGVLGCMGAVGQPFARSQNSEVFGSGTEQFVVLQNRTEPARWSAKGTLRTVIPSAVPVPYVSSEAACNTASVCKALAHSSKLELQLTSKR